MADLSDLTIAEIDAAIRAVLTNQSVTLLGRTITRADLGELRKLRKERMQEIRAAAGSGRGVVRFRYPT